MPNSWKIKFKGHTVNGETTHKDVFDLSAITLNDNILVYFFLMKEWFDWKTKNT